MRIQLTRSRAPMLPGHQRITGLVSYRSGWRPEKLWFDLPAELLADASPGDGWLVALLPLAFHLGEPLELGSDVDPVLLENARAAQLLWTRWYRGRRPVEIVAAARAPRAPSRDSRTALFFSSGLDSFFTLLDFDDRARAAGQAPIDDLVHVWGYDLPLARHRDMESRLARFEEIAARTGKRLLNVSTNLRHTRLDTLSWSLVMHGPALAAPLLMLGSPPGHALLSASGSRPELEAYGSHPVGDPLMSSSRVRFTHYGIEPTRLQKTARVARSTLALHHLHVCWKGESDRNCGRCLKCCLTQIALDLLDRRQATEAFDRGRYSLDLIRTLRSHSQGGVRLMEELRGEAIRLGRQDIVEATGAFHCYNGSGQGIPEAVGWERAAAKWRNSVRKRQTTLMRLVDQWRA